MVGRVRPKVLLKTQDPIFKFRNKSGVLDLLFLTVPSSPRRYPQIPHPQAGPMQRREAMPFYDVDVDIDIDALHAGYRYPSVARHLEDGRHELVTGYTRRRENSARLLPGSLITGSMSQDTPPACPA